MSMKIQNPSRFADFFIDLNILYSKKSNINGNNNIVIYINIQ